VGTRPNFRPVRTGHPEAECPEIEALRDRILTHETEDADDV
jgi:hypothetical protein